MSSNLLEVKDLVIKLHDNNDIIVKDINFEVEKSKVLGIIGESGSGKTMICKSIMGLLDTKKFNIEGDIRYKHNNIIDLDERNMEKLRGQDISLIMQNPMTAFDPMTKIGTQIIESLRAHYSISKKEAYQKGISVLKKMNLGREEKIMNSYPNTLSGGMLQRIMIAIAIMLKSKIIIADEITTALDASNKYMIIEELKKLRNSGITIVIITHDFGVLSSIADNIIVLNKGEIVESGSAKDIFNNPKEKYTQELLYASKLNGEYNGQCQKYFQTV
jgi:ABC-type dipeptide/oligopeptide/nickel transport system ATPase component